MKIKYKKSFEKDLDKLPQKIILQIFEIISIIETSTNLQNIGNIKKLAGHKNIYRIKLGDFRMGFSVINDEVTLERFLHRKDIYKNFPK